MMIDFDELLSDDLSDECAYELLHFMERLIMLIEARYYCQIKRYLNQLGRDEYEAKT